MPRSDYYDDESPPPRRSSPRRSSARVAEYEEVEISAHRGGKKHHHRDRDRDRDRDRLDFLADDHGHNDSAGPLVVREEEVIEDRRGGGRRRRGDADRERDSIEAESVISRSGGGRERDRPRKREVEEEEIKYRGPRGGREMFEEETRSRAPRGGREVVEEDIEIRARSRGPPRERREIFEEEEIRRGPRGERPVEREEVTEEIIYQPREKRRPVEVSKEEWTYRPPPAVARETEEWAFAPRPRAKSFDREEIIIKDREREPERPKPREREYREEEIVINSREPERPRPRDYREEEIIIKERDRGGPRGWHEDEIDIREREREPPRSVYRGEDRPRPRDYREEEITIKERDRGGARGWHEDEIDIRERDRERPRAREEEIVMLRSSVSHERPRPKRESSLEREEISIRREQSERSGRNDQELIIRREDHDDTRSRAGGSREEIIIRRNEPSPELPSPLPPPEPIRAPPIHQEIITHHRHVDHGFTPAYAPRPPPRSPSPKSSVDEIEIRRRGERNGRPYEEDITIDRRRSSPDRRSRARSMDTRPPPELRRERRDPIAEEAEYYARRNDERAYMGEGYNGATKDWAIVDVPPGTSRVKLDGIGGASQEVTWQRYNGVRRSNFEPDGSSGSIGEEIKRKYVGMKPKEDSMWTEITKDLIVREALVGSGYEFEETEYFYYVMEYLRFEDVSRLVTISDDLRARRRQRTRQIEWERQMPAAAPLALPPPRSPPPRAISERSWDEERERIVEREYYGGRSPAPGRVRMPPPPPREAFERGSGQGPRREDRERERERERDTVVVLR